MIPFSRLAQMAATNEVLAIRVGVDPCVSTEAASCGPICIESQIPVCVICYDDRWTADKIKESIFDYRNVYMCKCEICMMHDACYELYRSQPIGNTCPTCRTCDPDTIVISSVHSYSSGSSHRDAPVHQREIANLLDESYRLQHCGQVSMGFYAFFSLWTCACLVADTILYSQRISTLILAALTFMFYAFDAVSSVFDIYKRHVFSVFKWTTAAKCPGSNTVYFAGAIGRVVTLVYIHIRVWTDPDSLTFLYRLVFTLIMCQTFIMAFVACLGLGCWLCSVCR